MTLFRVCALLLSLCAATFVPPPALAQESADYTELQQYLTRYGELSEQVWKFQVAGKDLCLSSQVWLPGVYFNPVGLASTGQYTEGEDVPQTVGRVFADGPAAQAGLQQDDELLEINGESVVGKGWRGASRWDVVWEEVMYEEGPVEYTIRRDGQTQTITLQPQQVCFINLVYTTRNLPAPKQAGMVLINGMIDEVTMEPWQELAFLAPEVARTMNTAAAREGKAKKVAGVLSNFIQATTGMDLGVAQFGVDLAMTKKSRLEGDRVGLFLLARLGVDVSQVPDFWKSVYDYPVSGAWHQTFFGIRPTLAEREEVFAATLAEIDSQRAQGEALTPNSGG